ncbi:MAG: glycosyltransferase family 39 protein, partial [Pseudomonadota bacterium]
MSGPLTALPARLDAVGGTRLVVIAILAYVAVITLIRLVASPYLEIDEAQFVANVDLRLVYANSHPPLMNWLVRGALELTGWRWALALALTRALLLTLTLLMVFDTGRRLGGSTTGALALAAALLCPQVSWMSAHTLAHSLLVMTAAAGVLHGLALAMTRSQPGGLLLMGFWAGVGILAKYNIFLLLAPLAVALAAEPTVRAILTRRPAELTAAAALCVLMAAVAATGVWQAPQESTERISKLYRNGPFSALDVPVLGIDGVLALALSALAWGGIAMALVVLAARTAEPVAPVAVRVLRRTLVLGLAGFAVLILVADARQVPERYLTPLMMALPILTGLAVSAVRWRGLVLSAGLLAMIAVPVGIIGMVGF